MRRFNALIVIIFLFGQTAAATAQLSPLSGVGTREVIDLASEYVDGSIGTRLSQCRALPVEYLVRQRGSLLSEHRRADRNRQRALERIIIETPTALASFGDAFETLYGVADLRRGLTRNLRDLRTVSRRMDNTTRRLFSRNRRYGNADGLVRDIRQTFEDAERATSLGLEMYDSFRSWVDDSGSAVREYHDEVYGLTQHYTQHHAAAQEVQLSLRAYAFFELCVRYSEIERPEETAAAIENAHAGTDGAPVQSFIAMPVEATDAVSLARSSFRHSCITDCACVESVVLRESVYYQRAIFEFLERAPARSAVGAVACSDITGQTDFARAVMVRNDALDYEQMLASLRSTSLQLVDQCPNIEWIGGRDCWGGGDGR